MRSEQEIREKLSCLVAFRDELSSSEYVDPDKGRELSDGLNKQIWALEWVLGSSEIFDADY